MALIRLRGSCEAGNVCSTLIRDTDTGDVLVQGTLDHAAAAAAKTPADEGIVRIPADVVAQLLYGLGPDSTTDTPGQEVLG